MTPAVEYTCPDCGKPVANRRVNVCLYCGATLPASLLFSKEEIAVLKEQDRAFHEKHHRHWGRGKRSGHAFDIDVGDIADLAGDIGDF